MEEIQLMWFCALFYCWHYHAVSSATKTYGGNHMKKRDNHYKDFSNRRPYNNIPCKPGEVLVPFVVDWEMVKHFDMNKDNLETWNFKGKKVLVAFTLVAEAGKDDAMKIFNRQVHQILNQYAEQPDALSLDKMLDDMMDEYGKGKDPTGTASLEVTAFLGMVIKDLIAEVSQINSKYGRILELIVEDYDRGEILSELNLGKSQGYEDIKRARDLAKELFYK